MLNNCKLVPIITSRLCTYFRVIILTYPKCMHSNYIVLTICLVVSVTGALTGLKYQVGHVWWVDSFTESIYGDADRCAHFVIKKSGNDFLLETQFISTEWVHADEKRRPAREVQIVQKFYYRDIFSQYVRFKERPMSSSRCRPLIRKASLPVCCCFILYVVHCLHLFTI